jgi:hypothetical protein
MKSLKFSLVFTVLLLMVSVANAQNQRQMGPQEAGQMGQLTPEMIESLELTENQAAKFEEIRTEHFAKMTELRGEFRTGNMTPNAFRDKREALQETHQKAVRELLNDKQYATLAEIRQKQRRSAMNRQNNRGPRDGRMLNNRQNRDDDQRPMRQNN